jgi:hypothetical protein
MNRPGRLWAIAVLALLATMAVNPSANAADGQPLAWGAYPSPRSGESRQQAVERLERLAGRKLDVVRAFYRWNDAWPGTYETWLRSTGHTLIMSVKASRADGTVVRWADIANAQPGSALYGDVVRWAQRVRTYGVPIYVTFHHEPEAAANTGHGTATEYINAWRKWVSVFREQGVTNAKFMWIMTDYSFSLPSSERRYAPKWYPGDAWVDGIASDAYNWFRCRSGIDTPWMSLQQIIEPQRQFWLQHSSKEVWVTEYGSAEDPANPDRKAQWYRDARALFKTPAFAVFKGVSVFEADTSVWTSCPWQPDSSTQAAQAWREWGQDPYYGGPGSSPPPPPPPPPARSALLVVGDPNALGPESGLVSRLHGLGFTVTLADDNTVTPADATGRSVVLISQSVGSTVLGAKLRSVPQPVVIWKPAVYGDMGMTAVGANGATGTTAVSIIAPGHPLAAGRSGTVQVITTSLPLGWGQVTAAATVVATVKGLSGLFVYPAGAQMSGLTAPGCRVGYPLHRDAVPVLTADGWALFDRAVTWAADGCPAG